MLILISDSFHESLPGRLEQFGEVTQDKSRLPEADVVLIRSKTKCTREYLDQAKNLKLIIRGGVGLDNVDLEYAKQKGITVTNTPQASSVAVAELAMALMLAACSHVIEGHNGLKQGQWLKKQLKRTELYQKTLGLVGAGRIATEVGKRAAAFGMTVLAYDPYVTESEVATMTTLDDLLARSDYISLHTPLTDETRGMVNKDFLAKTKTGVIIVNTGRGKCINEADMAEALKDGHVAYYATDVYTSDPPPADSPLLSAPNVIMTPHIGASTRENLLRIGDIIVEKIQAFING